MAESQWAATKPPPMCQVIWTISTRHVRKSDDDALRDLEHRCAGLDAYSDRPPPELDVGRFPYGWVVRVPLDDDDDYIPGQRRRDGLSEAVSTLLLQAVRANVAFVRLDRDGPVVEGLPVFDW